MGLDMYFDFLYLLYLYKRTYYEKIHIYLIYRKM